VSDLVSLETVFSFQAEEKTGAKKKAKGGGGKFRKPK
jgi:hypothetical protein